MTIDFLVSAQNRLLCLPRFVLLRSSYLGYLPRSFKWNLDYHGLIVVVVMSLVRPVNKGRSDAERGSERGDKRQRVDGWMAL